MTLLQRSGFGRYRYPTVQILTHAGDCTCAENGGWLASRMGCIAPGGDDRVSCMGEGGGYGTSVANVAITSSCNLIGFPYSGGVEDGPFEEACFVIKYIIPWHSCHVLYFEPSGRCVHKLPENMSS